MKPDGWSEHQRHLAKAGLVVVTAALTSCFSYRAIKAESVAARVVSISCIELHEQCIPKDLNFKAVRFELTTLRDIGERLQAYVVQARCDVDGKLEVSFGPYHQGIDLGDPPHLPGKESADGAYHYVIYAFAHRDGLDAIAQTPFRKMRCSIWGVQKAPIPWPRTNYVAMTNAEFHASYEEFLRQQSAPDKSPEHTH